MREFLAAATPAVVLAFAVVASFTTPTALAFVATPPPTAMMNGVSSQQQRLLPSPSIHKEGYQRLSTTELASTTNHDENIGRWWQKAITTAVLTASFWSAPALLGGSVSFMPALSSSPDNSNSNSILVQNTAASAKEMASGSGSRVNKDPESLLRYGLPIQNKEVCRRKNRKEPFSSGFTCVFCAPEIFLVAVASPHTHNTNVHVCLQRMGSNDCLVDDHKNRFANCKLSWKVSRSI